MDIKCKKYKNILYVKISGEIDHHYSEEIREYIDSRFRQTNCIHIIFDFTDVAFMDSSGIGMLIGRYKNAAMRGGKVVICSINENLKRLFKLSGLNKLMPICGSFDDSLRSIENWGDNYDIW